MGNFRRWVLYLLTVVIAGLATDTPVQAYYGHRNYRSGRGYNRYGNRMAAMQRSSAAMNGAQARVYAAQMNLGRQTRLAKQQAEGSSGLTSAKTEHTQSQRDYQAAKMAVVENLKKTNPEFNGLMQQSKDLRQKVLALNNSSKTTASGDLKSVEAQLTSNSRRIEQIQNEAIDADSSLREILGRQASSHTAEVAAAKEIQNAIAKNPAVQAAQQQLAQAAQQAMMAANRYGNSSMGGGYSRGYGRGRGYGHRGGYGYGGYGRGYHVHTVRYTHHYHHRRR